METCDQEPCTQPTPILSSAASVGVTNGHWKKKPKMSCLWISFMLTIIVITTGKSYRTIVCTYIVSLGATDDNYWKTDMDDAMLSMSLVGRLLEDGVGWRWRMSTIQIHMGLYFQHWRKICQILDATLSPGSIEFVFVDCASIFVSVQGHGHITLQSMCNVWIDEMWNMVGIENLLFFIFLLTFLQRTQRHREIRKTPGQKCWHMGFYYWDDCN